MSKEEINILLRVGKSQIGTSLGIENRNPKSSKVCIAHTTSHFMANILSYILYDINLFFSLVDGITKGRFMVHTHWLQEVLVIVINWLLKIIKVQVEIL